MPKVLICVWLLALVSPSFSAQNHSNIIVDLANEQPGKTLSQFHNLTDFEYTISVIGINTNVSFFIVQVHTFNENITLSYEYPLDIHSYTTGTNVGLVWKATGSDNAIFYLVQTRIFAGDLKALIIVGTYSKDDPVPGGCNLSFETEIAPYQKVNHTDDVIIVMSQPSSLFGEFCNNSTIVTEMYYLYLHELNTDTEEYFLGIQKMMTVENITKYGTKVPGGLGHTKFKQMYNRYSGTGRIFAVVSTHEGRSSAYVPAASYGCNLTIWEEDCLGPVGTHWKIITALLLVCGLFLCLGGHRFFRTGLFIIAYTFGVFVLLAIVTIDHDFSSEGKAIYSFIVGVFVALVWIFLWWQFGSPVAAVQLAFLLGGFMIASILFYSQLGDVFIFADDLAFWACFAIVVVLVQMPLLYLKPLSYIIILSLLGSYAAIVAMNYYVGGSLQYILINTFRRMTVTKFGLAVITPPFQVLDIWQTILWAVIFGVGIYVQHKHSVGKPPFPPHRSRAEVSTATERTPLLHPQVPPAYTAEQDTH